jgi:hypothetical protein
LAPVGDKREAREELVGKKPDIITLRILPPEVLVLLP